MYLFDPDSFALNVVSSISANSLLSQRGCLIQSTHFISCVFFLNMYRQDMN